MKAFAYLRVSGMQQCEGDGFPRQRDAIQNYAAAHDITIAEEFAETGVSGTKDISLRPALQRLYIALEETSVKTIVIEKLDRLARDLMVQETIIADLRKHGITLISVAEPDLCSDDPGRILVRQIFGAVAQYERAVLVLRMKAAKDRIRKEKGRCEGVKPFGDNDPEKATREVMHLLRREGHTFQKIATILNHRGCPTRGGKPWKTGTVAKILSREAA